MVNLYDLVVAAASRRQDRPQYGEGGILRPRRIRGCVLGEIAYGELGRCDLQSIGRPIWGNEIVPVQ